MTTLTQEQLSDLYDYITDYGIMTDTISSPSIPRAKIYSFIENEQAYDVYLVDGKPVAASDVYCMCHFVMPNAHIFTKTEGEIYA